MQRDRIPKQTFDLLARLGHMPVLDLRQIPDQGREPLLEVRQQRGHVVGFVVRLHHPQQPRSFPFGLLQLCLG